MPRTAVAPSRPAALILWGLGAFLAAGVALFSFRYLAGGPFQSPEILANLLAKPWLAVHVAGAATALLIAPVNLLPVVRRRWPAVHRWLGRVYIVACLVGSAGGLPLAFGSTAGPLTTVGLGTLSVLWAWTNVQGWRTAVARRFADHRAWMIRSFALTFAAVTFRVDLFLFPALGMSQADGYHLTCFHCWMFNLLIAELYLRGAFRRRPAERTPAPAV
jgi:uncharacterized membrane protein